MENIKNKFINLERAKGRVWLKEKLGISERHYCRIKTGWVPGTKEWPLGKHIELLHKLYS